MTLRSLSICRLTLACISSEIPTKLLGMLTHLDCSSLNSISCRLVSSAVRCRQPLCVSLHQLLLSVPSSNSSLTGVPLPTSARVEISGSGLCLVSCQRLSAWRTPFVVSHLSFLTRTVNRNISIIMNRCYYGNAMVSRAVYNSHCTHTDTLRKKRQSS